MFCLLCELDAECFKLEGADLEGDAAVFRYRRFAAGVLHENDVEYPVARALAVEVVTERAFYPVSDEALKRAQALAESCGRVICAVKEFGPMNEKNRALIDRFSSRSSPAPAEA